MISANLIYQFKTLPDAKLFLEKSIDHDEIGYFIQANLPHAKLIEAFPYRGELDHPADEIQDENVSKIYFDIVAGIDEELLDNFQNNPQSITEAILDDFETSAIVLKQHHMVGEDHYFEVNYGTPYLPE